MPVKFLTDDEAAAHGLYAGTPSQADLDRVFFLDDDGGRHAKQSSLGRYRRRLDDL